MMKRVIVALVVLVVAGVVYKKCWEQPETTLTLKFDGGFAFVKEKDGSFTVAAPKDEGISHMHLAPMLYEKASGKEHNIDGWAVSFAGMTAGSVGTSTGTTTVYPKPENCSPEVSAPKGGSLPLATLTELPGGPAEFTDADLDARVTLSSGSLRILQSQGCWQLGRALPRGMVMGRESMEFSTKLSAKAAELLLTNLSTGETKTILIEPTDGVVTLRLGWPDMKPVEREAGDIMKDFARYFRLIKSEKLVDVPVRVALTDSEVEGTRPDPDCGSTYTVRK